MAKKSKEVVEEVQDLGADLEGEAGEAYFDYSCSAFTVSRNANGTFDLLVIRIDEDTDQAVVERETTRYDSISRALMDIKVRMEQELTKRGK